MKKKSDNPRLIQSIRRATDILRLFVAEKKAMGISEFARRLGLPKSTIQSIVQTLEALGFLERDPLTSRYRLGAMLFQLGMKYATNMDLVAIARVWMERLCFQFREAVNVGMIVGEKVVVLLRVEPENRFMTFPQAGSVIPAHTTCIGKILLAHMEPAARDRILEDCAFERYTENSIGGRKEFLAEIRRVFDEGIAFDNEESIRGLAGIGGPIFNDAGQVLAAFVLTGHAETIRDKREEIVNAVRYTSAQVSAQMGYKSGP